MKKTIFTLLLILSAINTRTTFASAVAGALEPTQWLNNFELVGVDISGGTTAIEQTLSTVKQLTDPIMAGLITVAQQAATKSIISWANAGFSGQPLIISNPENFIVSAGLTSVKSTLSSIPTNSVLGDSIFSSILNNNKQISIASQLQQLSKSPTASVIQKKNCDDPNTLMDLAKKQVAAEGGTPSEIAAKTAKLYQDFNSTICSGDPNTDPTVAKKLDTLAANNPSLGGWDLWLTSANDNEYRRAAQANQIATADKAIKATGASNDIFLGAGAVSEKVCAEYGVAEDGGQDASNCLEYTTINPAKAVQDSLSKAITSPLDRLANLTGADGLTSLLTGFITQALVQGLNTAFTSTKTTGSNTPKTTNSITPTTQDLANDPTNKTAIVTPILKLLKNTEGTLSELNSIDTQFLNDMLSYEARITTGRSCYNSLTTDFPELSGDGRVTTAYAFYEERQGRVDAIKNSINPEMLKIKDAFQFINGTKIKIANSNSTEEISTIYTNYSSTVDEKEYPGIIELAYRKGEYQKTKADANNDVDMDKYLTACSTIRQEKMMGNLYF